MRNKYLHLLLLSNSLIIVDQYTKFLVMAHVPLHHTISVIDNFFSIIHLRNPGVAFGLFAGNNSEFKVIFFIVISCLAIAALLIIFHQTPRENYLVHWGLILIFSGAVGNLIDRVIYREVIDFLYFFYDDFHFPAFNVADSCITVGVGLMIIDIFRKHHHGRASTAPTEESLNN